MIKIEFELKSICAMKMDSAEVMNEKQPNNQKGYLEQAQRKAYRDTKGNLAIPAVALKAAIREASSLVGKKTDAKKNREKIRAMLFIEPNSLSLGRKEYDCIAKDLVSRGQGTKVTRVETYRPLIKEWATKGNLELYGEGLDPEFIRECLGIAGERKGLLSHRPDFGRFVITKFEVKK
jgi:hypothetical protein